ncbi:DUF3039 domain-containing protein [Actinomyces urinae]|uniref:DUF3039 domain-containing protein n=1 Tax=Actinomyces urinae TaxID=1689268 RepID=UPI00093044EA|nr:DUF3039 domain-containing protein [Actinomyces urinae]
MFSLNLDAPDQPQAPSAPSRSTSTSVLERTETKEQHSPGDGDRFAHYVRRDRVTKSLITGQPVIALCGKVWIPMSDPSKFPVCPRCKALRDEMGAHGPNWPYSDGNE